MESLEIPYFEGFGPLARFRRRANPIDAKKYNYRVARTYLTNPNGLWESTFHILMWGLGGGVVAAHEAYMDCGMWIALPMNLIMGALISYLCCTLVWSAQKLYGRVQVAQLTYPDMVEACVLLAPWPKLRKTARCLRYSIEGMLMIHSFGSCCVFSLMIARNLKQLVDGQEVISAAGDPPIRIYILALMVPCAAVCMVTNLKYLAPFALVTCLYSTALVCVTLWYGLKTEKQNLLDFPIYKSATGFFEFIGVCIFVLQTVSIALPIENNMNSPQKFHIAMLVAMPIVIMVMVIIGFFGYWQNGDNAVAPITVHFPFSPFPVTLQVFLCIVLYVIYAISFYVGFDTEWFYIKRNHRFSNYWFWERLYRVIHVIALTLIAYAVPNVTNVMGLLGTFCSCPMVFLYPPLIELLLDWEHPGLGFLKWRLLKFIGITLIGLAILGPGTYFTLIDLIHELPPLVNWDAETSTAKGLIDYFYD